MKEEKCKSCEGSGSLVCEISGVNIPGSCGDCEGTGKNLIKYWGLVLCNKNKSENIWMHPVLFDDLKDAKLFDPDEHYPGLHFVKIIIEVNV